MLRRIVKLVLGVLSGMLLLSFGVVGFLFTKSSGEAQPVTDLNGKAIHNSISTIEKVVLGGQEQYLIIRGANTVNPIMLFVHGGPGSPEIAFMKHYNTAIENDFTMIYWEQRGAGKSYSEGIPAASMNLAQFISDARELSGYLVKRFKQEKIYIMGHSWGSLLGILTAYEYPELFHAYFGIGQVADQYRGEKISFEWVKEQAHHQNDRDAIDELSEMNFPDSLANSKEWMAFVIKERKYVTQFGGAMRAIDGMWPMVKTVLTAEEYTLGDKVNYVKGNMFSIEHLWHEVIQANLFTEIDSMQVPVYIFQGVYDYQTPYAVAKHFYEQLKAPEKEFYTFSNSAHSPIMEEVDKFNSIVREKVKHNSYH
jgi:pimeloyl-ACP methyl ester carboxylesterase